MGLQIIGDDFKIQYKEGKDNRVDDALSRVVDMQAISIVSNDEMEGLADKTVANHALSKILKELTMNTLSHPDFSYSKGCLWHKGRLVLPNTSSKILSILTKLYSSPWGGHSSILKTYRGS